MVKNIVNNVLRHLDWEEMESVAAAGKLLEKGFKRRIFQVIINPDKENQDEIHGVMVAFDRFTG